MSASPVKFRSDIRVVFDEVSSGGDRKIVHRAWCEEPQKYAGEVELIGGHFDSEGNWKRLIATLIKQKHGSPLEAGYLSVFLDVPAVVYWEACRHRALSIDVIDMSYSLESGRYKKLRNEYYIPPTERPCREPADFKPMRPKLVTDDEVHKDMETYLKDISEASRIAYEDSLHSCVAREIARLALTFNVYYSGYISGNPRSWLNFFSLRKYDEGSTYKSRPQWEIQNCCEQIEAIFATHWPLTYAAFVENGRVAV